MTSLPPFTLWSTPDRARWFLLPDDIAFTPGSLEIRAPLGKHATVDPESLAPYEMSREQARRWAMGNLGDFLDESRIAIDKKLEEWRTRLDAIIQRPVPDSGVSPEGVAVLTDLVKSLPRVIGQSISGDPERERAARAAMAELRQRFAQAGIELDERFDRWPERLAQLRREDKGTGPAG
jgi:hypothetical protein